MDHLTQTQRQHVERAIKPAIAQIDEEYPQGRPGNFAQLVATRAMMIAMIRSKRTWQSPAPEDARIYALSFVQ